jgi:hypothetical protein
VAESGVKYDYSNNEQWIELESQIKPLKEAQKVNRRTNENATKVESLL